ncbi:MAG TPA: alkaline phosphatase family protein, partial [Acidimicrobiia bacterium]|nr:alkaline phosphatase family protein [Acidimicrobiia bacterium]
MHLRVAMLCAVVLFAVACSSGSPKSSSPTTAPATTSSSTASAGGEGIHKIRHVIVIMQENRSFDSYFGSFPGADGLPKNVCVPDPRKPNSCVQPHVQHADVNGGGPHSEANAVADVHGGKMDGFVGQAEAGMRGCLNATNPACSNAAVPDVMGYHTASDIPNYWSYAQNFVLQDHMFEPNASWSLPEHLFQVSEWSASCTAHDPRSCTNALEVPGLPPDFRAVRTGSRGPAPIYAWTDLTYLLHKQRVSWGYYVVTGTEPDCRNDAAMSCAPRRQRANTPGIWNPLPYFDTVKDDGELGNIQSVNKFYAAARSGTLPSVSWIVPSQTVSEHPPGRVSAGQSYVTA